MALSLAVVSHVVTDQKLPQQLFDFSVLITSGVRLVIEPSKHEVPLPIDQVRDCLVVELLGVIITLVALRLFSLAVLRIPLLHLHKQAHHFLLAVS